MSYCHSKLFLFYHRNLILHLLESPIDFFHLKLKNHTFIFLSSLGAQQMSSLQALKSVFEVPAVSKQITVPPAVCATISSSFNTYFCAAEIRF